MIRNQLVKSSGEWKKEYLREALWGRCCSYCILIIYRRALIFSTFSTMSSGHRRVHIALEGESVKYCEAFKYLGAILDSSYSMNQRIDHVKKKVFLTCWGFSQEHDHHSTAHR